MDREALEELKTPDMERLSDISGRALEVTDLLEEIDDDDLTLGQCGALDDAHFAILSLWKLIAEVERSQWQTIGTAPDNKRILLWWRTCKSPAVGRWIENENGERSGWKCDGDEVVPVNQIDCTHWMHLPPPPALQSGGSNDGK